MSIVNHLNQENTLDNVKQWIKNATDIIIKRGICSVHDAWQNQIIIDAINELIRENQFPIRCYGMLDGSDKNLCDTEAYCDYSTWYSAWVNQDQSNCPIQDCPSGQIKSCTSDVCCELVHLGDGYPLCDGYSRGSYDNINGNDCNMCCYPPCSYSAALLSHDGSQMTVKSLEIGRKAIKDLKKRIVKKRSKYKKIKKIIKHKLK